MYARIRRALMMADMPAPFFEALARAGERLGIEDLDAMEPQFVEFVTEDFGEIY